MKGIGLVFAGGGGKGAYEIGVWKYLHEIGLDRFVRSVSGTSVGALNAALFTGGSYEVAEDLWRNIDSSKILSRKEYKTEDIVKYISSYLAGGALFLLTKLLADYRFSRSGLIELIDEGVNFQWLRDNDVSCFATCARLPLLSAKRFKLNNYDDDRIVKILLASSAIPLIFPAEEFEGHYYLDGGLCDNVPVDPVYESGVEHIFVVHLSRDTVIDKDKYPNSKIFEFVPSEDLGDTINGTLDFTPEGAARRIDQGYADAQKMLQPMVEMMAINAKSQLMLEKAQQNMVIFEKRRADLLDTENMIKAEMQNDGFNDLFDELMRER